MHQDLTSRITNCRECFAVFSCADPCLALLSRNHVIVSSAFPARLFNDCETSRSDRLRVIGRIAPRWIKFLRDDSRKIGVHFDIHHQVHIVWSTHNAKFSWPLSLIPLNGTGIAIERLNSQFASGKFVGHRRCSSFICRSHTPTITLRANLDGCVCSPILFVRRRMLWRNLQSSPSVIDDDHLIERKRFNSNCNFGFRGRWNRKRLWRNRFRRDGQIRCESLRRTWNRGRRLRSFDSELRGRC